MQDGRVHCSLNINTETGRLSCRRPNLQNQPALEKDRYFIRKAFRAEAGRKLAVADYGQLELRILAHLTDCGSMIEAFESGGDFHSRTAAGMFDFIQARCCCTLAVPCADILYPCPGEPAGPTFACSLSTRWQPDAEHNRVFDVGRGADCESSQLPLDCVQLVCAVCAP